MSGSVATPIFYWRPGCPFCTMLERRLDQRGIPLEKRNIWHDPDAAAAVRAVADGNETVPTVVVDEVAMINPSAAEVEAVMARVAPQLLPRVHGEIGPAVTEVGRDGNRR